MKTRKRRLKTRKRQLKKRNTIKGGAYQGNEENWRDQASQGNDQHLNTRGTIGYRNRYGREVTGKPHVGKAAEMNHSINYNANVESNVEEEENNQEYEEYSDYVDNLLEEKALPSVGCCTLTLQERVDRINQEISKVMITYDTLIQGIAMQTLEEYLHRKSLKINMKELENWKGKTAWRASIYQQTSIKDLNNAFLYLLPTFDIDKKYLILDQNKKNESSMHVLIQKYAYKMITALFTRSNITVAVLRYPYTPVSPSYQYLNNLLYIMKSGSHIINTYLQENWDSFVQFPIGNSRYVHSGGNLIVMVAGFICYLYDTWNSPTYVEWSYGVGILEEIRQEFELAIFKNDGTLYYFYMGLSSRMEEESFRENLRSCTEQISDLDFIFMGPDELVDNIKNPILFQVNELSAYVLRRILVTAHHSTADDLTNAAKALLPFNDEFDNNWSNFLFMGMGNITPETTEKMNDLNEMNYKGYRQTSNKVTEVPMFLNRLKQGYAPFYGLDLSNIPKELWKEYASKYGECIDLSIGTKENPLYHEKQENFKMGMYYGLKNPIHEIGSIVVATEDDKTAKRRIRLAFLLSIHTTSVTGINYIDLLFGIMGSKIT